ncbi:ion transporter [Amycolatopsis sp. NPDC048633]|uniref:ion transporter n=1 Tax=Amycolatopsis sp. NPDC048633 TaxID=3157095 RepID=UPI003411D447
MTTHRDAREPELNSGVLPGNVRADDWIMLVLAAGSVGLLGFMLVSPPARDAALVMFSVDCGICGVFLIEFLWRWRKRGWSKKFLVRNWYELFAMIPVAHPVITGHKFIGVVLLLIRIGRAADRAVGEQFTYRLVDKLSEPIVKAIKKPITIAVLDEVVKVLETGNYPENLAKSLDSNKDELRTIIAEKIAADPQLGKLKRLPFHDEIVRTVVDTSFRVLLDVLVDPRIDDFFSAVVRDNREQIRQAVQLGLNDIEDEDKEKSLPVRTQHSAALEYDRLHPRR